jgi:Ni,Fe-hydrogenase III component G
MEEDVITKIKEKFSHKIKKLEEKSAKRVYLTVAKEDISEVVRFIYRDLDARFIIASGVDTPEAIEILYHFDFDRINKVVSVRTYVDKASLEIESITPIVRGAEWIEREIWELLGVKFNNHPNLKRLLLAEDWPEGKHPLRRDYES